MRKLIDVLVFVLLVAVVVLAVLLWKDHTTTARIENYITKPHGLNEWMTTEPMRIRGRLNTLSGDLAVLCGWAEKNAAAGMKCPSLHGGPGGTGDVPKEPPPRWP